MLEGRFGNTSGRPYLEGKLYIPRFSIGVPLSFLVDTGADSTTLMPADTTLLGLDVSLLKRSSAGCVGIGGATECYEEPAMLVFADSEFLYTYLIALAIIPPTSGLQDIPSLLGRDVLDKWAMTYDPCQGTLRFRVRRVDAKFPIAAN